MGAEHCARDQIAQCGTKAEPAEQQHERQRKAQQEKSVMQDRGWRCFVHFGSDSLGSRPVWQ